MRRKFLPVATASWRGFVIPKDKTAINIVNPLLPIKPYKNPKFFLYKKSMAEQGYIWINSKIANIPAKSIMYNPTITVETSETDDEFIIPKAPVAAIITIRPKLTVKNIALTTTLHLGCATAASVTPLLSL